MISDNTSAVLVLTALTATLSPPHSSPFFNKLVTVKSLCKIAPFSALCVREKDPWEGGGGGGGVEGHVST